MSAAHRRLVCIKIKILLTLNPAWLLDGWVNDTAIHLLPQAAMDDFHLKMYPIINTSAGAGVFLLKHDRQRAVLTRRIEVLKHRLLVYYLPR